MERVSFPQRPAGLVGAWTMLGPVGMAPRLAVAIVVFEPALKPFVAPLRQCSR